MPRGVGLFVIRRFARGCNNTTDGCLQTDEKGECCYGYQVTGLAVCSNRHSTFPHDCENRHEQLIVMWGIFISILNLIAVITASYIEDEAFMKPKLEKNKIVNKGVWIKRTDEDQPTKTVSGDFIFRSNSLDADSMLHNNFDPFGDNFARDSMMVPNYVERNKRSANGRHLSRESRDNKNMTIVPTRNKGGETASLVKSKMLNKIKPETVFNDYPYEVAILLSNSNKADFIHSNGASLKDIYSTKSMNESQRAPDPIHNIDNSAITEKSVIKYRNVNATHRNLSSIIPKRSMHNDYESEIIKKIDISEEANKTDESYESNKMDRNVFENEDRAWHQTAPMPDVNSYKILPKNQDAKVKNKSITEKGLVKVLSMLTKTFKKVMKQHNDIKKIHTKLSSINEEFMKNAQLLMNKFQDFDVKYLYLMKFNENLKDLESKLRGKEEFFNNKEAELTKNLAEFEKQQKKFLVQQQQFYNIQKLMLAQNEKINLKQNLIAKTQNEISLRQNNFARILKKAKQIYIDTKNPIPQRLSAILSKPKESTEGRPNDIDKTTTTTTTSTETPNTESVKINLFSVPAMSRIINYDSRLLKEKDDYPVDDLIYKYYFNNTYIDVLMKNKILASFVAPPGNSLARNAKNKRNEKPIFIEKSTNLIPLNEFKSKLNQKGKPGLQLNRGKRWIKYSKKNTKRRHVGKDYNVTYKKEAKIVKTNTIIKNEKMEKDPFWMMANGFCKGIGQDENEQMLHWCIEKALRRLRSIETKIPQATVAREPTENTDTTKSMAKITTTQKSTETTKTLNASAEETTTSASIPDTGEADTTDSMFFPDNDQLESNLKQYDTKPDTEGTVYYDGSVHASQFEGPDSDGISDLMPGLDSDSRVDINPMALDLQQKRRANVKRINEDIIRQMKMG